MSIDIFDLDGTLALGGLQADPHNWPTLNEKVALFFNRSTAAQRWIMSGRAPIHRAVTEAWLAKYRIFARTILLVGDETTNDGNSHTFKAPYLELVSGEVVRLFDDDPLVGAVAQKLGIEWIDARALR